MTTPQTLVRPAWAETDPLLTHYYDTEWGMPHYSEQAVFERLSLEGFQSGLAWLTILRKREAFRESFCGFDVDAVAAFSSDDVERLVADERIIRNRAKIEATIGNAGATVRLRDTGTHLGELVWSYMPERSPTPKTDREVPSTSPESKALATHLKKLGYHYVGPTTVFALMTALGVVDTHLVSSHRRGSSGLWNVDGTRDGDRGPV